MVELTRSNEKQGLAKIEDLAISLLVEPRSSL